MIHVVIGTKAQLIKMAPVMSELQKRGIEYNFIFTGQHKEIMAELLNNFKIKKPDIVLYNGKEVINAFQAIIWVFRILVKTIYWRKKIFGGEKEGIILTHGDTFTTVLGALMGKIIRMKTAHVEAGLRSFDFLNPFPEEITRFITFILVDYYFAPNSWAINNLKRFHGKKFNTKMNTLYDSLNFAINNMSENEVNISDGKYAVVSIHRFENIFRIEKLKKIVSILGEISKRIPLVFILHLPTLKQLKEYHLFDILKENNNIELRNRMDYFSFIKLVYHSEFIITDGGSNQEESCYMDKPCLLLRNQTERTEGLNENVLLSKFQMDKIEYFVNNYTKFKVKNTLGDISPSKKIVDALIEGGFAIKNENNGSIKEEILKSEIIEGVDYPEEYFTFLEEGYNKKSNFFQDRISNVLEMVGKVNNKKILDIGCGIGTFAIETAKRGANSIGVGLSKVAIITAKKIAEKEGLNSHNCQFYNMDCENLEFSNNYFDIIIAADIVEHLPKKAFENTLKECYRALKNKGKIIIYTPNKVHIFEFLKKNNIILKEDKTHINLCSMEELIFSLKKAGFKIQKKYVKPSHLPILKRIEKILMNLPKVGDLFKRRLFVIAIK